MNEAWTVARILSWMAQDFAGLGVGSPRLDAELLVCSVLACDRVRLYMDMQRPLSKLELDAIRALVQRRRKREPVAYILGKREFYRHSFEVSAAVLVPRPETELLVDRALERLSDEPAYVLDLCTGSGAVAISLAAARPSWQLDATDVSQAALDVAARNARAIGVETRVAFQRGDLFAPLDDQRRYALITVNPPYVAEQDYAALAPEITQHEPKIAFVAGKDGLDVLKRICAEAPERLEPGGYLMLEIGIGQAASVRGLLEASEAFEAIEVTRDLGGIERVVEARRVG